MKSEPTLLSVQSGRKRHFFYTTVMGVDLGPNVNTVMVGKRPTFTLSTIKGINVKKKSVKKTKHVLAFILKVTGGCCLLRLRQVFSWVFLATESLLDPLSIRTRQSAG